MEKKIKIDGKDITFKCSAATPRIYRQRFGSDILVDSQKLLTEVQAGGTLTAEALETFENLAYVMAKQADPEAPDDPNAWLDSFSIFSIYDILPDLIGLWNTSINGIEKVKKKPVVNPPKKGR